MTSKNIELLRIACIIPTYNGLKDLIRLFNSLSFQNIQFDVFVIDSCSYDGSSTFIKKHVGNFTSIPSDLFNHGSTRNMAAKEVKKLFDSDIFIFLTQDVILASQDSLAKLISPFTAPDVVAVCGRQLPHEDANPLSVHARLFNYPTDSSVKSIADIPRLGIKTTFMSNSFSAYRSRVFFDLGGFPENTILAEDMYLAAKMIKADYKVAYCAEATVRHSHNYTPWEEFRRYFDTGVFHATEAWIREQFGGAEGEGMRLIRSELVYLWQNAPSWIPRALLTNVCKLLGYKLGQNYRYLPWKWRYKLSMYKSYWLQNKSDV